MSSNEGNQSDPRTRLYALIERLCEGAASVEEFCSQFERTYNFEIDKAQLSDAESSAFSALFDKIVWYSPFPEERKKIPNYLGEKDILAAVNGAKRVLADS